eukprot:SAG11_NODE_2156_length_3734_cov_22.964787_4_plen_171_part_00
MAAANTAFNISNGDTMVWTSVYPALAQLLGMEVPPPNGISPPPPARAFARRAVCITLFCAPLCAPLLALAQEAAEAAPMRLAEEMPQYAGVWDTIVAKHQLRPLSLETLVGGSWAFTDNSMGGWGVVAPEAAGAGEPAAADSKLEIGVLMSTIKLRQAGALSLDLLGASR